MAASIQVITLLFSAVIIVISSTVLGDEEFEGMSSLTLEHSFDSGPDAVFTKRGTLVIQSLKGGAAQLTSTGPLSSAEKTKLKELVKNDGIYRVRVPIKSGPGMPVYVSTFLKACQLYESSLSDILTLNTDQSGNILGLTFTTTLPYCQGVENEDLENFNTTVEVVHTAQGPFPETQTYIQRMEQEKIEKAKGAQGDNRSFLAKYWMYLVPLFLFLMIVSNVDPNQAQGGGR